MAASESFSFYVSLNIFLHEQITINYLGSEELFIILFWNFKQWYNFLDVFG